MVSNAGQPSKIPSQRVLWDNATAGLGPYGTPSMVCNILEENPFAVPNSDGLALSVPKVEAVDVEKWAV